MTEKSYHIMFNLPFRQIYFCLIRDDVFHWYTFLRFFNKNLTRKQCGHKTNKVMLFLFNLVQLVELIGDLMPCAKAKLHVQLSSSAHQLQFDLNSPTGVGRYSMRINTSTILMQKSVSPILFNPPIVS